MRKCVPSPVAWVEMNFQRIARISSRKYLVLYTSETIEHYCTVSSRSIINAGLHKSGSKIKRHYVPGQ